MNIKQENVWTEDGTKSVVVTWNFAGTTERKQENFSLMNQSQAETHEHLFKYFGYFMDILRETK
jgi:hypothetical protein